MDICEGLGVPVKSAGSPGDEDIATLKASPSNPSKHSSMGQDSAQTNSDISLRNRSTLMGFGGVHLPPSEIASCTAKDVDRGIGSGVARLSSCHHVQVRADLELFQTASFDWEERADVETESTDCAHSDPHFVDIGAPNTLAILQSSQTHDVSNEVKCLGGCPLLKACDVITVLRDLLYHANADDWFGYPGP